MLRKITRIFLRSLGILTLVLILLGIVLFFGVQSYRFQTWLGKRAGSYLSSDLNTRVDVESVELDFFHNARLHNVMMLDLHGDTLLHGDIILHVKQLDYNKQTVFLESIELSGITSKLIRHKGDSTLNVTFLSDYFSGNSSDTSSSGTWDVRFGDIKLNDVDFLYRDERYPQTISRNINWDNLHVQHVKGTISGLRFTGDTICANIQHLDLTEQSGFRLENLSTTAKVSKAVMWCDSLTIKTPGTALYGSIHFDYHQWDDYSDFINKIELNSRLDDSSYVSFGDIAVFAPALNGLYQQVKLSGKIKGTVSDLNLRGFKLAYGQQTRFNGNLSLSGLPDFSTSYLHFDAREISTGYYDLISIPTYPFNQGGALEVPVELKKLGTIAYKGKFDGFVTDFTTYGKFQTALGKLNTELSVKLGKGLEDIAYDGKLKTENFNLGSLFGQNDLNALSLNTTVKGKGLTIQSMETEMEGVISSITFNRYEYHNIKLNGSFSKKVFSGLLVCTDPNADFDFNGTIDFTNRVPEMDFISTINKMQLNELHFTSPSDSGKLSSQIFIKIKGDNPDNLSGQINFDNTEYKTHTKNYKLSSLNLVLEQAQADKRVILNSAYINGYVKGFYTFSNLWPALQSSLYNYYPAYFEKAPPAKKFKDELSFKFTVKKFNTLKELFIPDLMLSPGTSIEGNFNAATQKLNLQFGSQTLNYRNFLVQDLVFILNENEKTVLAEASGKTIRLGDSLSLDNFNFAIHSTNQNSDYKLEWDNIKQPVSKGEIKGSVLYDQSLFTIRNENISVTVTDSTWQLKEPNQITIDKSGNLTVSPMSIVNHLQELAVSGTLNEQSNDSLVIHVNQVILQQFNPLLELFLLKLEGNMQGHIALSNANNVFAYNGNLKLTQFRINNNSIGELGIQTRYNTGGQQIDINGYSSLGLTDSDGNQIKNIAFNGVYYLDKREEAIDIDFTANPANLKMLNPYFEGILTIQDAFVTGGGKIHGNANNIKLDGKLRLFNSEVKVDYTNVSYKMTGDIEIMPDQIRFSDLLMREKGSKAAPTGTVNGNLFHTNFSRMQLDYDISYKNMLVLNTTEKENKLFYGKVYSSGNAGIYGFLNNLNMVIVDTTTKNSKFVLPLDGPSEIDENDFISFVKKDTSQVKKDNSFTGFNLDLSIYATPAAQAQIILDKRNGDMLNVQGQGDLKLKINTLGKFDMYGDYFISNGDYLFTLEHVINKKFDIDAGSSISWSGNPTNAEINVSTSYKQRVSVAPLLNDTNGLYKGRFPVDCKLLITGKLFSPIINFAIDFPTLDATSKARINNVLSDEMELNRQVFSFLLFRTFVTPQIFNTNGGGVTGRGAAASTGSEMLSNRVSEFLNTYLGNFSGLSDLQLGLNYRAGSQNSGQAVDLALSKQFFNNKVSVDGNFGVNNNSTRSNGNNLIGDVNIEYKLSDDGRLRLRAFNRSNDNTQIATTGGPYTQGIGFFYRKEFEYLFPRKQRKK